MRFGVRDNRIVIHTPSGEASLTGELDKAQREEIAVELLGAVYLLMRDDLNSHRELVEFALDNLS